MVPSAVFFLFFLAGFHSIDAGVTNEDIRVAILQIVNVVRSTDDKLERHEYRDRVVGEQLKKGMINIDKRIKMLDPLKGTVGRLDERLAAVETILMQKNEREKMQLQRTYEAVLDIQRNLPVIMEQLKNDIVAKIASQEPPAQMVETGISKEAFEKLEKDVLDRMDKVTSTVKRMETDLNKIRDENTNLNLLNDKSSENLDKVKRHLDTSEQLLAKYENKLAEYNNKIPEIPVPDYKEQDEWRSGFLRALDQQKSQVDQVLVDVKTLKSKLSELPQTYDLNALQNTTLEKLLELKSEVAANPNLTSNLVVKAVKDVNSHSDGNHVEAMKNVNELSEITATMADSFATNYGKILNEIQALSKVNQVMVQTADGILDTKRRVEYGVHQILAEVASQIKDSTKNINQAIGDRFDVFETSMFDGESGAMSNITTKIGEDIHQVWRQIGIMHQQMTTNTDTLNRLQNQTDAYVNGSLGVMDNMKGKVVQITGKMAEVDENLNYLLGRLSLVTQEFNRIKSGLGAALDQIRDSFHTVQDKIKESKGPGPHKISSNEVVAPE